MAWNEPAPLKTIEEVTARLGIALAGGDPSHKLNEINKLHSELIALHTTAKASEPEEPHPAKRHR